MKYYSIVRNLWILCETNGYVEKNEWFILGATEGSLFTYVSTHYKFHVKKERRIRQTDKEDEQE